MQSAFLKFLDDLLFLHRFRPFGPPLNEVSCCRFKRLLENFALLFHRLNILFAVLNIASGCRLQVGNFCLRMLNVPHGFGVGVFEAAHLTLSLLDACLSHRHVCLADMGKTLQPLQTPFESVAHFLANSMSCWCVMLSWEGSSARCFRNPLIVSLRSIAVSMRGFEPRLYAPMLMRSSDFLYVAMRSRIS